MRYSISIKAIFLQRNHFSFLIARCLRKCFWRVLVKTESMYTACLRMTSICINFIFVDLLSRYNYCSSYNLNNLKMLYHFLHRFILVHFIKEHESTPRSTLNFSEVCFTLRNIIRFI